MTRYGWALLAMAACTQAVAGPRALDDEEMSRVTGQDGISFAAHLVLNDPALVGAVADSRLSLGFNGDGQNTNLAERPPVTYTYSGGGSPQINRISLTSLTAGATGMVDVTSSSTNFVDGQVTIGFGTEDVRCSAYGYSVRAICRPISRWPTTPCWAALRSA